MLSERTNCSGTGGHPNSWRNMSLALNTVLVGDALTVLKTLPDAFVDVTVTSPPYNKGERDKGWLVDKVVYEGARDCKDEAEYQAEQVAVLNELYRVTKPVAHSSTTTKSVGFGGGSSTPTNGLPSLVGFCGRKSFGIERLRRTFAVGVFGRWTSASIGSTSRATKVTPSARNSTLVTLCSLPFGKFRLSVTNAIPIPSRLSYRPDASSRFLMGARVSCLTLTAASARPLWRRNFWVAITWALMSAKLMSLSLGSAFKTVRRKRHG
ncbi:MAG: hypothetical protein RJAPGHWK_001047 [Candidatus Fervidibacter sp.]